MNDQAYETGTIVYTKDGESYSFSHSIGVWAYGYKFFQVQVVREDYSVVDDLDEVSEFLTRVKADTLSSKPWVPIIHKETAIALDDKKAALDDINAKIGAATMELREAERRASEARVIAERDLAALERKYGFIRDIKSLIGLEPKYVAYENREPSRCVVKSAYIDSVTFSRKSENRFEVTAQSFEGGSQQVRVFTEQHELDRYLIERMRKDAEFSLDMEVEWLQAYPKFHQMASKVAVEAIQKIERENIERKRNKLQSEIDKAVDQLSKLPAQEGGQA